MRERVTTPVSAAGLVLALLTGCSGDASDDGADASTDGAAPEDRGEVDGGEVDDGEGDDAVGGEKDARPPSSGAPEADGGGLVLGPLAACVAGDDCPADDDPPGTAVLCTSELTADPGPDPATTTATVTFDGAPVLDLTIPGSDVTDAEAGDPVTITYAMGIPLPAGDFGCTVTSGDTTDEATVAVDGPTEPLWELRTCDRADARELAPGVLVCTTDVEAFPDGSTGVVCSVGFQGPGGGIDIRYEVEGDGGGVVEGTAPAGDLPTATVNVAVTAAAFGGSDGDRLPMGDHTCGFSYGDAELAATFTVD